MTTAAIFTPLPKAEQDSRAIAREVEADSAHLATVASARSHVRSALRYHGPRTLTDADARHYAFAAMAALNYESAGRGWDGVERKVGPYVLEAVLHVLKGVDHTASDRDLVIAYACLVNVATRITV